MEYLQVKQTDAECTASTEHSIVYYATDTDKVWLKKQKERPYLCFTSQEDGSPIKLDTLYDAPVYGRKIIDLENTLTLYTSNDNKKFISWDGSEITLNSGEKVYIYGDNSTTWVTDRHYPHFSMTGTIKASGNIQSLISKDCPDTIPFDYCYAYMFYDCTSLVTTPELPATTLADYCYAFMFEGCTSLVVSSELPATTLAEYCCSDMFCKCTSLVTVASILPATKLVDSCYQGMFSGCKSLTTAPVLPATQLNSHCYLSMFKNCTSLTTAPELPAMSTYNQSYAYMFQGCTSLVTAPELPATTVGQHCYEYMFSGCTSLVTAPELPATTLAPYCYQQMFYGCTSLVTAPELPATTLAQYCYQQMFYGCASLNYIKAMFTTKPTTLYTANWVSGVASSGTFVKNSAATWDVSGVNGIPEGWTVQTADA